MLSKSPSKKSSKSKKGKKARSKSKSKTQKNIVLGRGDDIPDAEAEFLSPGKIKRRDDDQLEAPMKAAEEKELIAET